jgi:hypothetical protein
VRIFIKNEEMDTYLLDRCFSHSGCRATIEDGIEDVAFEACLGLHHLRYDVMCNTPGVYHQLSGGFKIKHDRLSGDDNIKVKPMEINPNLNLDVAPLAYI